MSRQLQSALLCSNQLFVSHLSKQSLSSSAICIFVGTLFHFSTSSPNPPTHTHTQNQKTHSPTYPHPPARPGEHVTECTGGPERLASCHLPLKYTTQCDPRLNVRQSIEVRCREGGREGGREPIHTRKNNGVGISENTTRWTDHIHTYTKTGGCEISDNTKRECWIQAIEVRRERETTDLLHKHTRKQEGWKK